MTDEILVKLEGALPCGCVVDALVSASVEASAAAAIVECPACGATTTLAELVEWSMERAADAAADRAYARGVLTGGLLGLLGAGVGFLFGLRRSERGDLVARLDDYQRYWDAHDGGKYKTDRAAKRAVERWLGLPVVSTARKRRN